MENLSIFKELENAEVVTDYVGQKKCGEKTTALVTKDKVALVFELLEIIEKEAYATSQQSYKFHDAIDAIKKITTSSTDFIADKGEIVLY